MGLSVKRRPKIENITVSVPASGTQDIILKFSKPMLIKSINITLGATTVLNSLSLDGNPIETSTSIDFVNSYGETVYGRYVVANVTNNNSTNAENTTVEVKGIIFE